MSTKRYTRLLTLVLLMLALSAASFAGIFVSITVAPPPLPVYVQPVCPAPGYIWTPGYWAWGDDGYYWVPGTWVAAPAPGMLWTPGYWGWVGGVYTWNAGYWGPHVGFYGGVNYGFGYGGVGFGGGEWRGGAFFYNTAVMNVNRTQVTNVYVNKTVIVNNNTTINNNVSFNGGPGGINRQPSPMERQAMSERHVQPTNDQMQHQNMAARNPQLQARNNGGRPAIAASARPGEFSGRGAVPAQAAGGHVDPAALHANARSMPAPRAQAPAANARPQANAAMPAARPQASARPASPNMTQRSSAPAWHQPPQAQQHQAPQQRAEAQRQAPAPRAEAHQAPPQREGREEHKNR